MKNYLLITLVCAALFSCNKNDDDATPITTANLAATASSGTWRITYYYDTDRDETSNFSGYSFTFAANDTIKATKPGVATVNGTWTTGMDNSKVKMILFFNNPPNFAELSEDWHVTERTNTRIKMMHVSGGSGGTDFLTFEKN